MSIPRCSPPGTGGLGQGSAVPEADGARGADVWGELKKMFQAIF